MSSSVRAQPSIELILRWSPAARCGVSLGVGLVRCAEKAMLCRPRHDPAACVLCSSTRSTRLPSAAPIRGRGQRMRAKRRYDKKFLHFELLMHRSPCSVRCSAGRSRSLHGLWTARRSTFKKVRLRRAEFRCVESGEISCFNKWRKWRKFWSEKWRKWRKF